MRKSDDRLWLIILALSVVGGLLRFYFVLRADFPLNEGGLFYVMIQDLQANHFRLPSFTTYNAASIPFAYPPLSFYVAGALDQWLNISLVDVMHYLPATLNTLAIPIFFLLALEILKDREQAELAGAVYILMLPSFEWLIMGSSLTRSFAYLFSLGSLFQAAKGFRLGAMRHSIHAGLLLGLTALSHLEIAMVTAVSILIFFAFRARHRRGSNQVLFEFGLAAILALPYFLSVAGRHGLAPFVNALNAGEFVIMRVIVNILTLTFTGETVYTPFAFLVLIGIWGSVVRGNYLLLAWLVAMMVINPRSLERTAIIPAAMAAGYGLGGVILPAFASLVRAAPAALIVAPLRYAQPGSEEPREERARAGFLVVLFFQAAFLVFLSNQGNVRFAALPEAEREAMAWVAANTVEEGCFLVLSNSVGWPTDKVAEWFPALSGRTSLNTVQGMEWLSERAFSRMKEDYLVLKECLFKEASCLETWAEARGVTFTHIYLSKSESELQCKSPCSLPIQISLKASASYKVIFENQAAVVFERR